MIYVLVPIYVVVCVFLILVVLLQQGKGADVASAFGASSSQTTFGARGATSVLEKVTTWSFVAFSVLAVAISLLQARPKSSVIKQLGDQPPAKSAPAVPAAPAPANAVPVAPATGGAMPVAPPAGTDAAPAPAAAAPAPANAPPAQK